MRKVVLSKKMLDYLAKHVSKIENEKDRLIRENYPEDTEESIGINEFFKEYSLKIRNYIENSEPTAKGSDKCPFAIIGSVVEVEDIDDKDVFSYNIVLPFSNESTTSMDSASCLSPLGKSLLLKSAGERVNVQVPAGTLHYVIRNITLPKNSLENKTAGAKPKKTALHQPKTGLSI